MNSIAQTYTISPDDTIQLTGVFEDLQTLSISQINNSADTLNLMWRKISESVPSNWNATVCDNSICYTTLVDSGSMNPVLPFDYGFILLHITPHVSYGTAKIRYSVWDINNPGSIDTLTFILTVKAGNPLFIPPLLSGTNFSLNIQNGVTQFYPGVNTPTFGINGPLLAPTLVLNKWDWVTMNVTNNLTGNGNATTIHWHGLHVPAIYDGGPHQIILQGSTWSPNFQVLNSAGTFWYHPHGANKTDLHVSKGIAGIIIIKDSTEAALTLPRTYGVDDFPFIVQTKCFDVLNQIAIATAFDTIPMVNGTVNPYLDVPAQVVRLRLLNGASDRSFLFGFSNNMNFHLIATDGGLIDSSLTLNRLRLSNGERAEILVDLGGHLNDTIFLMSYGSELSHGIMGADSIGDDLNQVPDYYFNPLNGTDFKLLQLNVSPQTGSPVTTIPSSLTTVVPWDTLNVTVQRTFEFDTLSDGFVNPNLAEGPFGINRKTFVMDSINEKVYLNTTEIWTVINKTMVAHPFHIHDMHFYLLDKSGIPVAAYEKGKKDVVLVMPNDSVRFVTRFEDFANDTVPYMYHCHLLHHEDDGMMGSFVVIDTARVNVLEIGHDAVQVFPNPSEGFINIQYPGDLKNGVNVYLSDLSGRIVHTEPKISSRDHWIINVSDIDCGVYFITIQSEHSSITKKIIIHH
ncbi:MAG: multicopper oxidase domain-containing protein [Bacteroidota bacterium]